MIYTLLHFTLLLGILPKHNQMGSQDVSLEPPLFEEVEYGRWGGELRWDEEAKSFSNVGAVTLETKTHRFPSGEKREVSTLAKSQVRAAPTLWSHLTWIPFLKAQLQIQSPSKVVGLELQHEFGVHSSVHNRLCHWRDRRPSVVTWPFRLQCPPLYNGDNNAAYFTQ